MDVGTTCFETKDRSFTLLDAPGHKDFIPNMISGATQADTAMLVIDASKGGFESGFNHGGQTREHAILVKSLGVSQLIIAINKLDTVDWSKDRFEYIQQMLIPFLKMIGFKASNLFFCPLSGYKGENIIERNEDALTAWYRGPTLVELMNQMEAPPQDASGPFRMPVYDCYKGAQGGLIVEGRIEAGVIQCGDQLRLLPLNECTVVKRLECLEQEVEWAMKGDRVTMTLTALDPLQVGHGSLLCDPTRPPRLSQKIQVKVLTLDLDVPLTLGVPLVLHILQYTEPCVISKVLSLHDKATGEIVKKNPRIVTKQSIVTMELRCERTIIVETFEECKALGRVTLRSGTDTVAVGRIVNVE
jgi:translation elongation factor EF-1alpha